MQHVKNNLCPNANTVILVETKFYERYWLNFFFLLQKRDFSLACVRSPSCLTDMGVDGGEFSLSSSSSNTMGFSTDPPTDKSLNVFGEKGVSMSGLNMRPCPIVTFPG